MTSSGGVGGGTGNACSGSFLLRNFSAAVNLLCSSMSVWHPPMYGWSFLSKRTSKSYP